MDALLEIQDCLQYSKGEKAKKKKHCAGRPGRKGGLKED